MYERNRSFSINQCVIRKTLRCALADKYFISLIKQIKRETIRKLDKIEVLQYSSITVHSKYIDSQVRCADSNQI